MDDVRTLALDEADQRPKKAARITPVRRQIDDPKAFRFEILSKRAAALYSLLQARHYDFESLSLEVSAQGQQVQFGTAGRERVYKMKNFHCFAGMTISNSGCRQSARPIAGSVLWSARNKLKDAPLNFSYSIEDRVYNGDDDPSPKHPCVALPVP